MSYLNRSLGLRSSVVRLLLGLVIGIGLAISLPTLVGALGTYNPRYDVNDSGTIDIVDVQLVAGAWNTSGTPGVYGDASTYELIVAKDGGEYQSIGAALEAITQATASQPYLVRVLPGVYSETITLKPYVHVQGSGPGITVISTSVSSSVGPWETATVFGASNARLSNLTVRNQGQGDYTVGIVNDSASPVIENVEVWVSGGDASYGIYNRFSTAQIREGLIVATGNSDAYGIYNYSANTSVSDLTVRAEGGNNENHGIHNANSVPEIRRVVVAASGASGGDGYGVYNAPATAYVNDSDLEGTTAALFTLSGSTTYVNNSRLANGRAGAGTFHCVGAFDASYNALDANCQ